MYSFYTLYETCKKIANGNGLVFKNQLSTCDNVQGKCGILTLHSDTKIVKSENVDCREIIIPCLQNCIFYKYAKQDSTCTLVRQEYVVAENLLIKCPYLPHFMRPVLYLKNHFVKSGRCKNPFSLTDQTPKTNISCVDLLVAESIPHKQDLHQFLKDKKKSVEEKNSIMMQIFLSLIAAQQRIQFTHNDLHTGNVLIMTCKPNIKLLYKIKINNTEHIIPVKTFGYIPVIIDYGFSYSKNCKGMSVESFYDNYGIISYQFDNIADFIKLFINLLNQPYGNIPLEEQILSMLKDLPLDLKLSWEKISSKDSFEDIETIFTSIYKNILDKKDENKRQYIRLMCRNVIIPVKYNSVFENFDIEKEIETFLLLWVHIDKWFKYNYEKIFLFRQLCDSVRKTCNMQLDFSQEELKIIVGDFMHSVTSIINENVVISVNWNKLVLTVNKIVGCMQNILYNNISSLEKKRKQQLYSKLISGEHMLQKILPYVNNYHENLSKRNSSNNFFTYNMSVSKGDFIVLIDTIEQTFSSLEISQNAIINTKTLYNFFN